MAKFLHHEPCPRCGSRDNLARYSDGSGWCFGCHKILHPDDSSGIWGNKQVVQIDDDIQLSDDLCNDFPRHVVEWLGKYDVSVSEALKHGWKYSPKWDQLVFSFVDDEGKITCSQARNFRKGSKRKYYNQGSTASVLPIFQATGLLCVERRRLVVVEDAVSAAKIARQCDAMPCLGSHLPAKKIAALKLLNYEQVLVWLDSDKLKEAREIETMCKWIGLSARTIYTELDPKEYSNEEIMELLK